MNYKKIFKEKGITNINSFFNYMQNQFNYGWIDQNKKKHNGVNDASTYRLQSPIELLDSHLGICWDMTELSRCFFENMTLFRYETYYLYYDDRKGCPSHFILVYYDKNKVYWFEPMFNDNIGYYSGIHEYENIIELLTDFRNIFIKNASLKEFIPKNYNINNIYIYKYKKPKYHINGFEMREHIDESELINISNY